MASNNQNKNFFLYARHDPELCLAPGLFRSLKRGSRNQKWCVTYGEITFCGEESLGVDDLRVLQVLMAIATENYLKFHNPTSPAAKKLIEDLKIEDYSGAIFIESSYAAIARNMGYEKIDGGSRLAAIKNCISRLCKVSMTVAAENVQHQMISCCVQSGEENEKCSLFIAINPRTARVITKEKQKFTRIDMSEVRKLSSDHARLIHQRLCGWINPGKGKTISIEKLCSYVWPDQANNKETMKKRRKKIVECLEQLNTEIGWKTHVYSVNDKVEITRPDAKDLAAKGRTSRTRAGRYIAIAMRSQSDVSLRNTGKNPDRV